MNALLFPGQGSQIVGMGKEFYNNFDKVKQIFNYADQRLNFPISKIILEGPENDLQLTKNTQPAILTVSYSIFKVLKEEFNMDLNIFKYFAGHSLGEYSALVCSEALDFQDALYLLHERGKAMQEAVPVGQGGMIAVLGIKVDELKKIIKSFDNKKICEIANDNAEGQIILSGEKNIIDFAQKNLKERKIKSIPLKVSAPFHCSLMKPAALKMEERLREIEITAPKIPVVQNVTAAYETDPNSIRQNLVDQVCAPVRWTESIKTLWDNQVESFVECGPGRVLSGLIKRANKRAIVGSLNAEIEANQLKSLGT